MPVHSIFTRSALFEPIDNSQLVVFRIVFGLLIFLESAGAIITGWVKETFINPTIHFTFIGFEWLQPLPGYGMYWYYGIMSLFGLLVMLGVWYRLSIAVFTLMWTATYLMQKASYNNHYYLLIILCLLMACVPANRYLSFDVKWNPGLKSLTCPSWCVLIFVIQIGIVFTYAGIAKLQPDWMSGRPMDLWFTYKTDYPIIGPLFETTWMKWVVAYGGILYDLFVVPLLLWRRTRLFAFGASVFFHLFNSAVFQIGIFPYLMIGATVLFFPPEIIRRIFLPFKPKVDLQPDVLLKKYSLHTMGITIFTLFFLLQILLPLRHILYPGNVNWTEEGHRMSWRMMLRSKSGTISFKVKDTATGKTWDVYPTEFLTWDQSSSLATHPDMVWQFVQFLKKKYTAEGISEVEIYAVSSASLNGRPYQPLIDETVNLAAVEWKPFRPANWIVPLKESAEATVESR